MKSTLPLLDFYRSSLSNSFNSLVKPIENLELDVVLYTFIQRDGAFFQIGNFPEVLSFYWEDPVNFKSNPFIRNPKFYTSCTLNLSEYPSEQFQDNIHALKQFYNSSKVMACFHEDQGNIHWIGYGSTNFKLPLGNLFVNERMLLEKFSHYIIENWKANAKQMDRYLVGLPSILGPLYNKKPDDVLPNSKSKLALLRKIGIDIPTISLSKREKQCLILLDKGRTAREIGQILEISTRTVETHLEHIKNKLSVNTKSETIEKGRDLIQFGFLKES